MKQEHKTIIKLGTECYLRGSTYFVGRTMRTMKRLSTGWDILNEEVAFASGVEEFMSMITTDFYNLPDGLYELSYDGFWKDWETGDSEVESYKLTPYSE